MKGNAAVRAHRATGRAELLDEALSVAAQLARVSLSFVHPLSLQLRAAVAYGRGDSELAGNCLLRAQQAFGSLHIPMYELYTRRARGYVLGGKRGQDLLAETEAALRASGVANVERWTWMKLPGFAPER